jgi:hypothetical protein
MKGQVLALSIALSLMVTTGCATKYALQPADRTPAATGQIKANTDANGNRELEISVKHLPPASSLDQTFRTFVVWVRPGADATFRNVGQLRLDDDRRGELSTTTPYKSFDVMVTAEASGTSLSPSEAVILRGHVGSR